MKSSTHDIAKAAIDAAYDMLKANGMEEHAAELARDLRSELGSRQTTVVATLWTPSGNAGALAESIKSSLEKRLGKQVELTEKADKNLLGGAILEYGDMRIDMSLRGSLDAAKEHLEHASAS